MKIVFQDQSLIDLNLFDTEISKYYIGACKHLQNIKIPFKPWDAPFYYNQMSFLDLVDQLIYYACELGIEVDQMKCQNHDQSYFNYLHTLFEKYYYDGNPKWNDFHEHIHLCETYSQKMYHNCHIRFREKARFLIKPIIPSMLMNLTNKVKKGDAYIAWHTVGKIPHTYWANQEPNDIKRICELAKPWVELRPIVSIALDDINFLENISGISEFNLWWEQYHDDWCQHWKIPQWTVEQMFGVVVIGKIFEVDQLTKLLQHKIYPERLSLL
jgi:hypothetical protein